MHHNELNTNAANNKAVGQQLYNQQRYHDAIHVFNKAISYNKHDYKLYYYKGKALAKLGYYLPAVVQLDQALMCCNDQNRTQLQHYRDVMIKTFERKEWKPCPPEYNEPIYSDTTDTTYYNRVYTLQCIERLKRDNGDSNMCTGESRAREHEDTDIPLLALTQDCLDANL